MFSSDSISPDFNPATVDPAFLEQVSGETLLSLERGGNAPSRVLAVATHLLGTSWREWGRAVWSAGGGVVVVSAAAPYRIDDVEQLCFTPRVADFENGGPALSRDAGLAYLAGLEVRGQFASFGPTFSFFILPPDVSDASNP